MIWTVRRVLGDKTDTSTSDGYFKIYSAFTVLVFGFLFAVIQAIKFNQTSGGFIHGMHDLTEQYLLSCNHNQNHWLIGIGNSINHDFTIFSI